MTSTAHFTSLALHLAACAVLATGLSAMAASEDAPEGHTERVTVTSSRLPDGTALKNLPANVTLIDRESIEKSGAATSRRR